MLVFPTVRHTGSHFVVGLFGFNINQGKSWKHNGEGEFYFDHIHPSQVDKFLPILQENTVVVPLRHPKVTAQSWKSRKKCEQEMIECFDCLVDVVDKEDPHYLPLDSDRRDKYLDALNSDLGLNLTTDWGAKGVKQNNQSLRHQDVKASPEVEDLCNRIKPFLDRFY